MSDLLQYINIENSNSSLHKILKSCAEYPSSESLTAATDYNDECVTQMWTYTRKMSPTAHSINGSLSTNSDECLGDNILEENGRISLAYENLERIPRRVADKFAAHTKFLDLSYNNFQNLTFLAYFEELHTLILDHNKNLRAHTFPYLLNLKILWINNCNIINIIEWIQRIEVQCPQLEQLSIMGNPGIKKQFNYCTLDPHTALPISLITDYRTYVLDILPKLQYLDGLPRLSFQKNANNNNNDNTNHNFGNSTADSAHESQGSSSKKSVSSNSSNNSRKSSPTLNFKDLFRLTLKKRVTYHSSSTN